MKLLTRPDLKVIKEICLSRPTANHSVEQYLMTAESLYYQLISCELFLKHRKVIFIGDDDHLSILASLFFKTQSIVVEIDNRIISNQKRWEENLKLTNHKIFKHDVRNKLNTLKSDIKQCDGFVINPPYGSKNQGYGTKIWISRAIELLKKGSFGILILPINLDLNWSITNMLEIQKFLASNNCIIVKIDNDLHTYEDLPDPNLRSSNISIFYLGKAKNLISTIPPYGKIYR